MLREDIIYEDTFYCSELDLIQFKQGRVWRELKSWIEARRNATLDALENVENEWKAKELLLRRKLLGELLALPDHILDALRHKAANEDIDEREPPTTAEEQV